MMIGTREDTIHMFNAIAGVPIRVVLVGEARSRNGMHYANINWLIALVILGRRYDDGVEIIVGSNLWSRGPWW